MGFWIILTVVAALLVAVALFLVHHFGLFEQGPPPSASDHRANEDADDEDDDEDEDEDDDDKDD